MAASEDFSRLAAILSAAREHAHDEGQEPAIKPALDALFETRYQQKSRPRDAYRDAYSLARKEDGVPYAGIIAPENPPAGAYGGASVAWFPCEHGTLMTFVVGTKGLSPDEGLLTRDGHRRRVTALRHHLTSRGIEAWAKADPTAINVGLPATVVRQFDDCKAVFSRYGSEIYSAAWIPAGRSDIAAIVAQAYIDLYAHERGWVQRVAAKEEFQGFLATLQDSFFSSISPDALNKLIRERRFVVLQGPPGTGKTRMAEQVRARYFAGHGRTVQFHPAVTYEDFIVGLSPDPTHEGLRFRAKPGWLLDAATAAVDAPYLLIVDEINRGDLSKVLGEAIYLFEPAEVGGVDAREVHLAHAVNGRSTFRLPPNLFVLATMNTADRSIAGLDLAVRRRFAFVTLMPDRKVIGLEPAQAMFDALTAVFFEHGSDDMLHLLPGHSYFLASDEAELRSRFQYDLLPLLDEYLRQGVLGSATIELHAVREQIGDYVLQAST